MRIGGVSVGKVKSVELAPPEDSLDGQDLTGQRSRSSRSSRRSRRRTGDPPPEDAARRDLRRAHLRQQADRRRDQGHGVSARGLARRGRAQQRRLDPERRGDPRRRLARLGQTRTRRRSTRSSTPSTRRRGPRSSNGSRARRRDPGRGLDLNDALGNLGPFLATPPTCSASCAARRPAEGARPRHGYRLRRAQPDANGQLADAIAGTNGAFETLASEHQALRDTFQIFPTFEKRDAADARPPRLLPAQHAAPRQEACSRSPATSARPCTASASSPQPELALRRPRRPRPRLPARLPEPGEFLHGAKPALDSSIRSSPTSTR